MARRAGGHRPRRRRDSRARSKRLDKMIRGKVTLITGAAGFVGTKLADRLLTAGGGGGGFRGPPPPRGGRQPQLGRGRPRGAAPGGGGGYRGGGVGGARAGGGAA